MHAAFVHNCRIVLLELSFTSYVIWLIGYVWLLTRSLLAHSRVLAVVVADADGASSPSLSSCVSLVLTQERVDIFDTDTDTQLQSFTVADVDCQLMCSATDTRLLFSRKLAAAVVVSYNV